MSEIVKENAESQRITGRAKRHRISQKARRDMGRKHQRYPSWKLMLELSFVKPLRERRAEEGRQGEGREKQAFKRQPHYSKVPLTNLSAFLLSHGYKQLQVLQSTKSPSNLDP